MTAFEPEEYETVYEWIICNSGNYLQACFNKFVIRYGDKKVLAILKLLEKQNLIYAQYEMEPGGDSYEHLYATRMKWLWQIHTGQRIQYARSNI